jgi:hypothetical protein
MAIFTWTSSILYVKAIESAADGMLKDAIGDLVETIVSSNG